MQVGQSRCENCVVRKHSLCGSIDGGALAALGGMGRRKHFAAGDVIAWSGDENLLVANVVDGALKITASTEDGREQIVGLLYRGDFMGQPFAEEAPLTVTALGETDLCLFPRGAFERTLADHPRLERSLLLRTMAQLDEARQRMLALGRKNAQERLAGFLIEVIERTLPARANGPLSIEIPISRGEMADFLGLTIETVSRQLAKLRSAGVIEFSKGDRSCTVLDRAMLQQIAAPN